MIGVLLSALGAFFEEVSSSIAKQQIAKKQESVYTMGFLNTLWAVFFFAILLLCFRSAPLSLDAWPTFLLRAVLTMSLAYFTVNALAKAERSTYGFIRTGTIPMLLVGDLILGNAITGFQMIGMAMICAGLLFLFMNHGFTKRGVGFACMSALNASIVVWLYKYNITHGNSVELEQFLTMSVLLVFFYVMSRSSKDHILSLIKRPIIALQSGSVGIATILESFAYVFAPASIILAATRSSSVVFTVLSGGVYFHEKHLSVKIVSLIAFVVGIVLLAMG